MIAYNTQWLDALAVKTQSRKWHNSGLLSLTQLQEIEANFQAGFYTPNIFVRIGLGIFCWILVSSILGLLSMTLFDSSTGAAGGLCLFFSLGILAALEYLIRKNSYYKAGIDDALLYMALSMAIAGISLLFSSLFEKNEIFYFLLALPLLVAAAVRYADTVATTLAFVCLVAIVFMLLKESSLLARLIPLACMLVSAGIYYGIWQQKSRYDFRFWSDCLLVLEACCLLLFYVSGNYFVVDELGEELIPGFHIPFKSIFWIFTAATPLVYIYFGLLKHNRLLLRIGLLIIALSVLTFKSYFSLGHHEVTLTIAGFLLVIIAYFSIRYLKNNKSPFTYAEDKTDETVAYNQLEALLIAQTSGAPAAPEKQMDFGGGRFGGGGAGGNF